MASVRTCRAFIPAMREAGWGRVIPISSEDAVQPYLEEMPYCACKAAMLNLAKALSKAYAKDGVLVNTVSPAYIATLMTDTMMEKRSQQMGVSFDQAIASFLKQNRSHIELKRRRRPEEVADVIDIVLSDQVLYSALAIWWTVVHSRVCDRAAVYFQACSACCS